MALTDELLKEGNFLFRWRSYGPALILPLLVVALWQSEGLARMWGEHFNILWKLGALGVAVLGLLVRCLVGCFVPANTSGRNTKEQLAFSLNTSGLYSIVRHPLYLGNYLSMLGLLLFVEVWWLAVIASLLFWLYYERICLAEEAFLAEQFGEEFYEWAARTPAFIPQFRLWRAPSCRFCWQAMLRREHTGFFLLITIFLMMEVLVNGMGEGIWVIDSSMTTLFFANLGLYLTILLIKKKTPLLAFDGR